MAEVQMRFRTDSWHYADMKAKGTDYTYEGITEQDRKEFLDTPKAEPGDVWRIRWYKEHGEGDDGHDGPLAGYAICCLKCGGVHQWTTATNCSSPIQCSYKDKDGNDVAYTSCSHSGNSSCWQWSGSAEDNTLSGSPSLQNLDPSCAFHGYLTNGILRDC